MEGIRWAGLGVCVPQAQPHCAEVGMACGLHTVAGFELSALLLVHSKVSCKLYLGTHTFPVV
jgi:hypothetical protein